MFSEKDKEKNRCEFKKEDLEWRSFSRSAPSRMTKVERRS